MATHGELLRLARQLRGYTQKETALTLGIAQAILSRAENDLIDIDEGLRQNAARAFSLPQEFFETSDPVYGPPVSVHTMLRGKKSQVSARDVGMISAELNVRLFHLRRLFENVDFDPVDEVPMLDIESMGSVERVAATVRVHWKIPSRPIKNLTRLLERAGVVVGFSDFRGAAVSGVTFSAPGFPPLILINSSHPADRLRFTLAHELGHLVMHRFPTPEMEHEANHFASAFLLPPDELRDVLHGRKITLSLLASLKREWRMSMQSILMAAHRLGCISDNQNRYLWQQFSLKSWRIREPASLDFPVDRPSVLPTIIRSHLESLGFKKEELIRMCRINEKEFDRLYGMYEEVKESRPMLRIVN